MNLISPFARYHTDHLNVLTVIMVLASVIMVYHPGVEVCAFHNYIVMVQSITEIIPVAPVG